MMEVHRQSGGFTPPVVAKRTSRYRGPVGSGNPTGVNSSSACRGGRIARINVECLNLVRQGGVIPLGLAPLNTCPLDQLLLLQGKTYVTRAYLFHCGSVILQVG